MPTQAPAPLPQQRRARGGSGSTFRFSLSGLIVFSISLIVTSSALTWLLMRHGESLLPKSRAALSGEAALLPPEPDEVPEWGELVKRDIEISRPDEYMAFDLATNRNTDWIFARSSPDQVRSLMQGCGVPVPLIERALSPEMTTIKDGAVIVKPDDALLTELPAEARSRLYAELAKNPANSIYITAPFSFKTNEFEATLAAGGINEPTAALIRKLSYQRGSRTYFSDLALVLKRQPDDATRLNVVRALSRVSALLVQLRIRPNTDIDRVAAYWSSVPGVRLKDVRPLLESVQREKTDPRISIAYMLPPFARERLYTFPLSTKDGEAEADCHWSTLNFFNEKPDDRFYDPGYTSAYIAKNYYPIAKPGKYGDLIFLSDDKGNIIHSAVYIADDIVFTKNGRNFGQPWLLMRLDDVISMYSNDAPPQMLYYRVKSA